MVYGLGLQLQSNWERGKKKTLRVNADPRMDSGDSHAPVPFYVTTRGYGVLVDTARYATFWCGGRSAKGESAKESPAPPADPVLKPYVERGFHHPSQVLIEVPSSEGVDLYIFAGPAMRDAVARYNLFSGGGCLPSKAGLGIWYRAFGGFRQDEVLATAAGLRERNIPCDVLGLEPGWQTHAYACSFVWNKNYPDPKDLIEKLSRQGFGVNLWEHAYTHPTSPIYKALEPYSAEYEVFGGFVPDFLLPEARRIFADFHEKEHVALGVTGYKLDECDNSDYAGFWSFPEISRFPSGLDGEQAHSRYGFEYQQTVEDLFARRNLRTYGLVRSSGALAAPLPFALYSDLIRTHRVHRGVVNCGYSGLLWSPEVRDAANAEDLIRRLQTVVFSPLALVNAWYIRNPPWKQVNSEKNNAGDLAQGWQETEGIVRDFFQLRMRLVPYLYSAFFRYYLDGTPAVPRAGARLSGGAARLGHRRCVPGRRQPAGGSAHRGQRRARDLSAYKAVGGFLDRPTPSGGSKISVKVPLDRIPVFVKGGTLLPLAKPTLHAGDAESRKLEIRVYGDGSSGCTLFEDDGATLDYRKGSYNRLRLSWDMAGGTGSSERLGQAGVAPYVIEKWVQVR